MWTYNCARVYVGVYSTDTNEFCHNVTCEYEVLKGNVNTKRLKPVKVRPQEEDIGLQTLQCYALYPATDTAIIAIHNNHGKRLIRLVKHQIGTRSTIFKERL